MSVFAEQFEQVKQSRGFIAALDQSGGSTPKALKLYGIEESAYSSESEMFDLVHEMRTRIMTDSEFNSDRILGAILFEMTMDRSVEDMPSSQYLWEKKRVVPFLKVDKGLEAEANGVQLMKPIPGLSDLLDRAKTVDVFGTKMRSVIKSANADGIKAIVDQQFEIGGQILAKGLVPIIEPEVDINATDKAACEAHLKANILAHLNKLEGDLPVMLKLTLPDQADFYKDLVDHPKVLKVVALSGGYPRDLANEKLAANHGMIASFSRALSEGLSAKQSDGEFSQLLGKSITAIVEASRT